MTQSSYPLTAIDSIVLRASQGDYEELSACESLERETDAWHEAETGVPLNEWLGMTEEEYSLYVECPENLTAIIDARKLELLIELSENL